MTIRFPKVRTASHRRMPARAALGLLLLAATAAFGQEPFEQKVVPDEPATLRIWNREILTLRARVGGMSPTERVEGAKLRMEAMSQRALGDEVRALPAKVGRLEGLLLLAGEQVIVGLVPEDLDPHGAETLEQVAARAVEKLREVLDARMRQRALPVLLRGGALSLGATLLLVLALWGTVRLRGSLLRRSGSVGLLAGRPLMGVDLGPILLAVERIFIRISTLSAALFAIYVWLTFVFRRFPLTEPWGDNLGGYLASLAKTLALGALHSIPGLFTVVIILWIARFVSRAVSEFFSRVESGQLRLEWLDSDTARATRRLALALLWICAIVVAYPYIPGSGTDAFKGVSVFVGLMVSLGATGFINQVMSGLVIVYSRAFKIGDFVRVGEREGVVDSVGLLSTKVLTRKREELTIPNAVLVSTTTVNYSRLAGETGALAWTSVTIGYDAPWRQVYGLLMLAAERTPGVRREPRPEVFQTALSDFYVEYELRVWIDRPKDRVPVLSALHEQIQDAFNEFGVQIMSPHFESQPAGTVVVPRGKWQESPAVRDRPPAAPDEPAGG